MADLQLSQAVGSRLLTWEPLPCPACPLGQGPSPGIYGHHSASLGRCRLSYVANAVWGLPEPPQRDWSALSGSQAVPSSPNLIRVLSLPPAGASDMFDPAQLWASQSSPNTGSGGKGHLLGNNNPPYFPLSPFSWLVQKHVWLTMLYTWN